MRRRRPAFLLAGILLVAVAFVAGRRTTPATSAPAAPPSVTVTVPSARDADEPPASAAPDPAAGSNPRTPAGAVTAAAAYVAALSGPSIADPGTLRRTLTKIASSSSREDLIGAYEAAAADLRDRLGPGSVVVRAAPVGYRVDGFHARAATVSVWRVGIVGSASTLEPQQSWRTETVSLVWEGGAWKLDAVRSMPGPTPPLAGPVSPPAELLEASSGFEEFASDLP